MLLTSETARKQEAEEKLLDAYMTQCDKLLDSMRDASPAEAGRIELHLEYALMCCPHLPMAFRQKTMVLARAYECSANMRAAGVVLQQALHLARDDDWNGRNERLAEGRLLSSKAIALGANQYFQHAVRHKIENIMLTGGVGRHGPTAARPWFGSPESQRDAKS
jgi:hypothetical protein